ncbi:MAG: HAMP domain-containing protein [Prevotella sp.]|nr:HAMP domain-containing protein [Prevotella sp.]
MLYYSRRAVKEEALQNARITLDGTVQHIDNILLSVEQTTGNIYFSLLPYLNQPEMILTYSRRLVESNPYVTGCAIAFKEDFFKDHKYFMAYVHRSVSNGKDADINKLIEETTDDGEYLEQTWYKSPMTSMKVGWQRPMIGNEADEIPIITFCLPILGKDGSPVGIMGVGVSLTQLSSIIAETKPSRNSYCTLINNEGIYIAHPNSSKFNQKIIQLTSKEPSAREAAEAMISGQTGYKAFRLDGKDYYVFYKPFERITVAGRTIEALNWSAGIVYPENDIFGDYHNLFYYVLAIAIIGLLLLFLLYRTIIHRQLKPLLMLTASAQRIAEGHYDEIIPNSRQEDEIGQLQDNFQQMQLSLANYIGELEQLTITLQEQDADLHAAYEQAQKADRMKTAFLHYMTNQMIGPAQSIEKQVDTLVNNISVHEHQQDIGKLADNVQQKGNTIAELLKNLINMSDEENGKEERV